MLNRHMMVGPPNGATATPVYPVTRRKPSPASILHVPIDLVHSFRLASPTWTNQQRNRRQVGIRQRHVDSSRCLVLTPTVGANLDRLHEGARHGPLLRGQRRVFAHARVPFEKRRITFVLFVRDGLEGCR